MVSRLLHRNLALTVTSTTLPLNEAGTDTWTLGFSVSDVAFGSSRT